ncbi:hypothetical protein COCOBI_14-3510 [Coccomyxa sp. Obi]|nr:hypothetical protein COCOBI_14-3510 [Coccomyxa sp. Obi]
MGSSRSWKAAYSEIKAANTLDTIYSKVEFEIHQHLDLLKRDARVRVKQWLHKFRQETANTVWKRNRNIHARLLLEQLRAGRLTEPFTSLPGPGCLPTLGRWALAPFLTPQKKSATSPRKDHAVGMAHAGSCPPRLTAAQERCSPLASTSGRGGLALDAYCGRHAQRAALQESYRSGNRLEEPWRRSASPEATHWAGSPCKDSPRHQHNSGAVLAGTNMRFTSPGAAARADPAIVAGGPGGLAEKERGTGSIEGGHPHRTVALEAALGACREKALELELRLRSAEQRIQMQALERQQQEKRIARKDVDKVIDKFEKQRGRWSSPQRREFEDITQQLHEFQKATEQLKKHMSSVSASGTAGFLDQSFATPQHLTAPSADVGSWTIAAKSGSAAESQPSASDAAVAQMGKEAEHETATGAAAADRKAAGASLEALWGDAGVQLQDGAVSAGRPQQSSREVGVLDEDELAEFSEETRALLRQIHAISL